MCTRGARIHSATTSLVRGAAQMTTRHVVKTQPSPSVAQIGSHGCLFVPTEKSARFVLPRGEYFRPVLVGDHPLHGLQRLDADVLRHGHFVLEHVVPLVVSVATHFSSVVSFMLGHTALREAGMNFFSG